MATPTIVVRVGGEAPSCALLENGITLMTFTGDASYANAPSAEPDDVEKAARDMEASGKFLGSDLCVFPVTTQVTVRPRTSRRFVHRRVWQVQPGDAFIGPDGIPVLVITVLTAIQDGLPMFHFRVVGNVFRVGDTLVHGPAPDLDADWRRGIAVRALALNVPGVVELVAHDIEAAPTMPVWADVLTTIGSSVFSASVPAVLSRLIVVPMRKDMEVIERSLRRWAPPCRHEDMIDIIKRLVTGLQEREAAAAATADDA